MNVIDKTNECFQLKGRKKRLLFIGRYRDRTDAG